MTAKETIYKEIRDRIVLGTLNPGEHLTEAQLSGKFGVSRGPIREALTQLSREGFVTLTPNKGAMVAKTSPRELEDFYSLLALLERQAVEWATPSLTEAHIEKLAATNESLRDVITSDQEDRIRQWTVQNLEFHSFFWGTCGNEKLGWLVKQIRQRIFRYRYTSLMVTSFEDYFRDHADIIEAVRLNDPHRAGQIMEQHIKRALRVLMDFFSHMPNF